MQLQKLSFTAVKKVIFKLFTGVNEKCLKFIALNFIPAYEKNYDSRKFSNSKAKKKS